MAPLTIFAGANSSGKSTLIQSLLLTAQTLQSSVYSRSVILNGHIERLGRYDDIVSNAYRDKEILIGFQITTHEETQDRNLRPLHRRLYAPMYMRPGEVLRTVECYFTFSADDPHEDREVLQLQPQLNECYVKGISEKSDKSITEQEIQIKKSNKKIEQRLEELHVAEQDVKREINESLEYEVIKPNIIKGRQRRYYTLPSGGRAVGATFNHFLPSKIAICFDAVERQYKQLLESMISINVYRDARDIEFEFDNQLNLNDKFKNIIFTILQDMLNAQKAPQAAKSKIESALKNLTDNFTVRSLQDRYARLPIYLRQTLAQKLTDKNTELQDALKQDIVPKNTIEYAPLPYLTDTAIDYTEYFFSKLLKYLGPLRDEPKPVYPLEGAVDPKDIGFKGEHTAAVLEVNKNTKINYVPTRNFADSLSAPIIESAPLIIAVLDWLEYMGIAKGVKTFDKGTLGHELKVATLGSAFLHDLTHVGVGVSQVLPILVLSLLAEQGSTLIFEQPELHLHPRVQTRLADFFMSMTMLNKQCIVETHSEYLINRLRYQAAVSEGDQISKNVIIYFVEKPNEFSIYRPIRINKFGVIKDWPLGFFDENEENAAKILKAAMKKRKKEVMPNA